MDNKKYISVEDAIKTTWMILDGLGYAFDENPQLTKAVLAVFDTAQTADVRPVVRGKNIGEEYDEVDQFVCSECGIELQGWVSVEHDEDTWETTYHEYRLNFCPNCGADMREES